ncbi:hypothetical protein GGX14DRAFT_410807 [Mycena pura]|uniref:Uncharacterized protein n=1 Tax=Mycena pura TaxID=153505 RepID=A0AAD7E6J5_9AGAR|nr:hypothetical protein GGX14DRAFT_410807 [Mycena pura]
MADFLRAKSGRDWSDTDLQSYRILLRSVPNAEEFFEVSPLPASSVRSELLTLTIPSDATDSVVYQILRYMELARFSDRETHVDLFSSALLEDLGYLSRSSIVVRGFIQPLVVCGENKRAKIDVGIMNDDGFSLLVHKTTSNPANPVAQLMVQAIATLQNLNTTLERSGRATLRSKLIPAIVMRGTKPTFFKIPVTVELAMAVVNIPLRTRIPVEHEGMWPPQNRAIILSCYEAFKKFHN